MDDIIKYVARVSNKAGRPVWSSPHPFDTREEAAAHAFQNNPHAKRCSTNRVTIRDGRVLDAGMNVRWTDRPPPKFGAVIVNVGSVGTDYDTEKQARNALKAEVVRRGLTEARLVVFNEHGHRVWEHEVDHETINRWRKALAK